MCRLEKTPRIVWLLALIAACTGCRSKGGGSSEGGAPPVAPGPTETPPPVAPSEPSPDVAGIWVDDTGDSPWESVHLTATDEHSGRYVAKGRCRNPPCPPPVEGDYVLEGRRLSLRTDGQETDWFEVHVGGEKMEWRKDDVMIRRFREVGPPRPPADDPSMDRYPPECARPAPGTACGKMTAAGCLWSPECVLEAVGHGATGAPYRCRPAVPPCEGGIAQGDDGFEDDCKGREGCRFQPSECFCPGARTEVSPAPGSEEEDRIGRVSCTCGGGPYRRCLPAEAEVAPDASPDVPADS